MSRPIARIILLALIPLALLEGWWMTPDADYYKPMDFAVFYAASRAFLHGQNPYDRSRAEAVWDDAGGEYGVMDMVLGPIDDEHPEDHWLPIEVIPPGLLVFGAFAAFGAGHAWTFYNGVVALLLVGQVYATIRLMRRPLWDAATLAMVALTALLEPLHIGLANGQPTVPTVSLLVMCLWFSRSGRPWVAGLCFAVATALKPQLAAPFVMLLFYQRRYKTVAVAAGIGLALTVVAIGQMEAHRVPWVSSWVHEVRHAEDSEGIDNARVDNPGRHDLMYLGLIGHLFTDNATVVNAASMTVYFGLVAGLFYIGRRDRNSLAVISAFAVLTLLPMYHRYYDGFILVLPLAWVVVTLISPGEVDQSRGDPLASPRRRKRIAVAAMAIIAVYFISEEWLNQSLFLNIARNHPTAAGSWWFNDLLEPHHAWEMLAMAGLLIAAVGRPTTPAVDVAVPLVPTGWWWQNRWRLVVAAMIPLAFLEARWMAPDPDGDDFKNRGPMDFAMYYTAGRMFDHGQNPYNRGRAVMTWDDADTDGEYSDIMEPILGPRSWDEEYAPEDWLPVNLMPAGVAVMGVIAWMTIPFAWPAWNVVVYSLLALQVWSISRLMKFPLWDWRALLTVVITLLLEPLHVGLGNGQPAVPAVSLTIVALWLSSIDRQILGGVALALATALKPQLAGPFVFLFLWNKQWKLVGVAAGLGVALTLAAVIPMQAHGLPWFRSWVGEIKYAEVPGGINDPRISNGSREDMMHLQLFFHAFTDNALVAGAMAWTVTISLGAAVLMLARRYADPLAVMASFAVMCLLPVYHRLYDAGILVVPAAWAVANLATPRRRSAVVILVVTSLYFVSQPMLDDWFIEQSGMDWTVESWWFNVLAEPHHPLELLVILACLMYGMTIGTVGKAHFPTPPPPKPGLRVRPKTRLMRSLSRRQARRRLTISGKTDALAPRMDQRTNGVAWVSAGLISATAGARSINPAAG